MIASLSRLRVVAITDRRLMVPAALQGAADWSAIAAAFGQAVARAVAGCPAGSVVVQVREKDLDGGPLLQLVRAAQPFAPVVVNDRLDVALAAGAAGVHLPERGLAIPDARRLAPGLLLGVSRHAAPLDGAGRDAGDAAAAAAAPGPAASGPAARGPAAPAARGAAAAGAAAPGPAASGPAAPGPAAPGPGTPDLIQLGPIWTTPSKPMVAPLGEVALAWPHGAATLVAVGGIDSAERAAAAAASGADAVAVIRAAWTGGSLAAFVAAVEAGRARRSL